jgi:hypothetical protein
LDAGGRDSIEIKILWSESPVQVRPRSFHAPAHNLRRTCRRANRIVQLEAIALANAA